MTESARVTRIQERAKALRALAAELSETIKSAETKEYFLRLPINWLGDVEGCLLNQATKTTRPIDASNWLDLAEWQLLTIEAKLKQAQDAVRKYGPDLRLIGG
jgi:hypothetical protein